jgi:hypothetical protein
MCPSDLTPFAASPMGAEFGVGNGGIDLGGAEGLSQPPMRLAIRAPTLHLHVMCRNKRRTGGSTLREAATHPSHSLVWCGQKPQHGAMTISTWANGYVRAAAGRCTCLHCLAL